MPDLPNFIDKANYALQLIAEGKLNLVNQDHNSIEMEKLKIKSFRNNVTITFFISCNFRFNSILINNAWEKKNPINNLWRYSSI